jgi:hypothetical protein
MFNHRRSLPIVAAAGALAVGVLGLVATTASAHEGGHRISFASAVAGDLSQSQVPDLSRCGPPPGVPSTPCVVPLTPTPGFDWIFTGDVSGIIKNESGAIVATIIPDPTSPLGAQSPFDATYRLVGMVANCGSGSFILQIDSQGYLQPFTWKVVAHSGTDGLTKLSGGGSGTPSVPGSGTYTGRLGCRNDSYLPLK